MADRLWEGWSADASVVARTRVLARLLLGQIDAVGNTSCSVSEVAADLDLDLDAFGLAAEFAEKWGLFRADTLTGEAGDDALVITARGTAVAREFREAQSLRERRKAARRALLCWLYEVEQPSTVGDFPADPRSWFYGTRFTAEEIGDAATTCSDRKLMTGTRTWGGTLHAPRLTTLGKEVVERYEGDFDAMSDAQQGRSGVNINTLNQHGGNSAIGSSNFTQLTTEGTIGQTVTDLAEALQALMSLGLVPEDLQQEANQTIGELATAKTTPEVAPEALGRSRKLLAALGQVARPAAAALGTALGNYAAVHTGLTPLP